MMETTPQRLPTGLGDAVGALLVTNSRCEFAVWALSTAA